MIPDKSIEMALTTWYDKDNPLHLDPRHACIKLAGEAGEILDLYGKHEYKPNFSWWKCTKCGFLPSEKVTNINDHYAYCCFNGEVHTPLILDELGDYSYYLRILAYQQKVTLGELCEGYKKEWFNEAENDSDYLVSLLTELLRDSSQVLEHFIYDNEIILTFLRDCAYDFLAILSKLDTTLDTVLDLNYKKLNSEPTNHGWRNAKMKTIDDCPPMNPKV